jgi:hypothetical protein
MRDQSIEQVAPLEVDLGAADIAAPRTILRVARERVLAGDDKQRIRELHAKISGSAGLLLTLLSGFHRDANGALLAPQNAVRRWDHEHRQKRCRDHPADHRRCNPAHDL